MGLKEDLNSFMTRLEAAIDDAMENEVADAAKSELADTAYERVYEAYEPQFYDRWWENGGLLDTSDKVMKTAYDPVNKLLEVTDDPEWHNRDEGAVVGIPLAEAVEKGINMHGAGPRPFHAPAEKSLKDSGRFGAALMAGLKRNGFD